MNNTCIPVHRSVFSEFGSNDRIEKFPMNESDMHRIVNYQLKFSSNISDYRWCPLTLYNVHSHSFMHTLIHSLARSLKRFRANAFFHAHSSVRWCLLHIYQCLFVCFVVCLFVCSLLHAIAIANYFQCALNTYRCTHSHTNRTPTP